jgi:hypothetical protein
VKILLLLAISAVAALAPAGVSAAPSAEVAKTLHPPFPSIDPYKRLESVRMSGRQAYLRDCMAKGGNVPEQARAKT